MYGVGWGLYAPELGWCSRNTSSTCNSLAVLPLLGARPFAQSNKWHIPRQYLHPDPYVGRRVFAVIRHPYTRAVSEYSCPWSGYKGPNFTKSSMLNFWLKRRLERLPWKLPWSATQNGVLEKGRSAVSLLPQHIYLQRKTNRGWASKVEMLVDHILGHEQLQSAFSQLMKCYGFDVKLGNRVENGRTSALLSASNLTANTRTTLDATYAQDFEVLGYRPHDWTSPPRVLSLHGGDPCQSLRGNSY